MLGNVNGNDENGVDPSTGVLDDGALTGWADNLPVDLSQLIISGSLPPNQPMSTFVSPRSGSPLAHTAANASPILLNGIRAVPFLGGLSGAFFGGFKDRTIALASTAPNGERRAASESFVASSG